MKVTEHFWSEEFDCHDGTPYPAAWIDERLRPLCGSLEIIRGVTGGPVLVLSGYRTKAYNREVGGAPQSMHLMGMAADIIVPRLNVGNLRHMIFDLIQAGELPLVHGLGTYLTFVHVDHRGTKRLAQWTGSRSTT